MSKNWTHSMPTIQCYQMSRVLYDIHHHAKALEKYKKDPNEYMRDVPLPASLKAAIRDNDIGAMYLEGVNPLLLRAHCLGLGISEEAFVTSLQAAGAKAGASDG